MQDHPSPAYIRTIVDYFAEAVEEEMDLLEYEMRLSDASARIYRHRYDVAYFVQSPTVFKQELALGFVQIRSALGNIVSAIVWANQGTGEVWSRGWPPEPDPSLSAER